MAGRLPLGRKSFTFTGSGFGGLVEISLCTEISHASPHVDYTLTTDFEAWVGKDVRMLPYFDKLARLHECLLGGWTLQLKLEIEGMPILHAGGDLSPDTPFLDESRALLDYTTRARKVASRFSQSVEFRLTSQISKEDNLRLAEAVDTLELRRKFDRDSLRGNVVCTLIADAGAGNIKYLREQTIPSEVTLQEFQPEPLLVFGQEIRLPQLEIILVGVLPKVSQTAETLVQGAAVSVEWVPAAADFHGLIRYMNTGEATTQGF
jgi:hypothetical protein